MSFRQCWSPTQSRNENGSLTISYAVRIFQIDLPKEDVSSDKIIVTGRKENVLAARDAILDIQSQMVCGAAWRFGIPFIT